MEQPMSGPEPEAPAHAGPGEPEELVEPEGGAAEEAVDAGTAGSSGSAGTAGSAGHDGPAGPQPIGVGVTPTGRSAVDARLRRLADADHLPAGGHLQVYEDVHRGLREVLAALDQHPGPPAPSSTFSTPHDNRS